MVGWVLSGGDSTNGHILTVLLEPTSRDIDEPANHSCLGSMTGYLHIRELSPFLGLGIENVGLRVDAGGGVWVSLTTECIELSPNCPTAQASTRDW